MHKTLIVAQSEFATLVRTKAFLISLFLMPVVMGGSVLLIRATKDSGDVRDRRFAYVDGSGVLGPAMEAAAIERHASAARNGRPAARFIPVEIRSNGRIEEVRLELSDRVRRQELFAFVEIPADVLSPDGRARIRYYSALGAGGIADACQ